MLDLQEGTGPVPGRDQAVRFLYAMIDPEGREDVTRMITQADRALQRTKER